MADIKDQLIKNSYNYVLQSDLSTGVVYRIGGTVPVNPIFLSGLTVNSSLTYSNGTEQPGYFLTTDGSGYSYWSSVSGTSLYITGTGVNSTVRCGVNNTAAGDFGGSLAGSGNTASGKYSFVGGGRDNTASGNTSTISGGYFNNALSDNSHVLAGQGNLVYSQSATILGGNLNSIANVNNSLTYSIYCTDFNTGIIYISGGDLTPELVNGNTFYYYHGVDNKVYKGNITSSTYSGGYTELQGINAGTASSYGGFGRNYSDIVTNNSCNSVIAGGNSNTICGNSNYSFIGGGRNNTASCNYSTVSGGYSNTASCYHSTVSGGLLNTSSGYRSTVGGGAQNTASSIYSTVGGGFKNNSSGQCSTVGGGVGNTASGYNSTISGGRSNTASGLYSFIAGGVSNNTNNLACAFIVGSNITADMSGTTFVNQLSIKNIPTSSAGLSSGAVWSNGGNLEIIP
jgi:hypothetical protein